MRHAPATSSAGPCRAWPIDWRAGTAAIAVMPASAGRGGTAVARAKDIAIHLVGWAAPTGFHGYPARGAEAAGASLGVKVTYIFLSDRRETT